jgi:hypothetical protein
VKLVPPLALGKGEWLQLRLESESGAPCHEIMAPRFGDGATAVASVSEPGRYHAYLDFLQQALGDLRSTPLPLEGSVTLQVEERDGAQAFEVPLPPGARAEIERARADPPPK